LLSNTGLEYIGGEIEIRYGNSPFSEGELTDSVSKMAVQLKYNLNPFADPKPVYLAESALVINRKENFATVPDKQGTLRDKFYRVVLYKGEFSRGFRQGQGVGSIFDLSKEYVGEYSGTWHQNMRHGYGELKNTADMVYQGEWKYDMKSGVGIETDSLGSKYIGTFHNDTRHGSGRFIWGDGTAENREYRYGECTNKSPLSDKVKAWDKWSEVQTKIDQMSKGVVRTVLTVTADDLATKVPEAKPFTGLAAKRELKQIQDTVLPKFNQEMSKIGGLSIQIDVDWNSFTAGDRATVALWMLSAHDGIFILSAIPKAIVGVCQDPLGKQALANKVKKILLKNRDKMRELSVTMSGQVMEIVDNFGYEDARLDAPTIQKKIELLL